MSIYASNSVFQEVDLSLLKHFFAVATFGGFSKASRATGISQPALSLGIQKLEKSLGLVLIDREARPFELTPAGQALRSFCQRFQDSFASTLSALGKPELSARRRLRIGTALSVGFGPLDDLCANIESAKDTFELELLEQNTYHLLSQVHEGQLDAAFVPNDVFDSRLRFIPILSDQIVFIVGTRNRGSFGDADWREVAARVPLITFPREAPMRTLTDKVCAAARLEFKTVYSINNIEALKLLVEQSRGGAFVLRALVASELKSGRFFEEPLPIRLPRSGISLVLPAEEEQSAASRHLLSLVKPEKLVRERKMPRPGAEVIADLV